MRYQRTARNYHFLIKQRKCKVKERDAYILMSSALFKLHFPLDLTEGYSQLGAFSINSLFHKVYIYVSNINLKGFRIGSCLRVGLINTQTKYTDKAT